MTIPHTQENFDAFYNTLTEAYRDLFKTDPLYSVIAQRMTPEALARKVTIGLDCGTASKDGEGVKRTCEQLGIAHTYKAIRAYLGGEVK